MRHLFAAAVLLTAACGDSSGPSVVPEHLAGEWSASPTCLPNCGFTFIPVLTPEDSLNFIQQYGITIDMSLTRAGRIEIRAVNAGVPVDPIQGQVTVEANTLILRDAAGAVDTVDYELIGTRLRLSFRDEVLLGDMPSRVRAVFQRR